MKPKHFFLALALVGSISAAAQLNSQADIPTKVEFDQFVEKLQHEAEEKKLVQLRTAVKLMNYEEALQFWHDLKSDPGSVTPEEGNKKKVALLQWGLVVNAIFSRFSNIEDPYEAKMGLGWAFGTYFMYQLSKIYLVTELLLTRRVFINEYNGGSDYKETIGITHLMLAFSFMYAIELSTQMQLMLGLGPYIAYALSGKETFETPSGDQENDLFENDGVRRFDAGLQAVIGLVIMPRLYLYFAYCYSFGKLFENSDIGMRMFRIGVALSILNYKSNQPGEMRSSY